MKKKNPECKKCGSETVKNGIPNNKQKYKCTNRECNSSFYEGDNRLKLNSDDKFLVALLHGKKKDGQLNTREIANFFNISNVAASKIILKVSKSLEIKKSDKEEKIKHLKVTELNLDGRSIKFSQLIGKFNKFKKCLFIEYFPEQLEDGYIIIKPIKNEVVKVVP